MPALNRKLIQTTAKQMQQVKEIHAVKQGTALINVYIDLLRVVLHHPRLFLINSHSGPPIRTSCSCCIPKQIAHQHQWHS